MPDDIRTRDEIGPPKDMATPGDLTALPKSKERLDRLLESKGVFESRERARSAILAGTVYVDGRRVDKPGTAVQRGASVEVRGGSCPFVGRGGLKLEGALDAFGVDVHGRTVLDVGASTGGFTDCLLQRGAARVYAVDVGRGQLAWRLRQDPRVVVLEQTNARYLTRESVPVEVSLATVDVSFISLSKVLPAIFPLLEAGGGVVALVKPQFEAGREQVGKGGVVKNALVHERVLLTVIETAGRTGLGTRDLIFSPLLGPKGNIEFFLLLTKGGGPAPPAGDSGSEPERDPESHVGTHLEAAPTSGLRIDLNSDPGALVRQVVARAHAWADSGSAKSIATPGEPGEPVGAPGVGPLCRGASESQEVGGDGCS